MPVAHEREEDIRRVHMSPELAEAVAAAREEALKSYPWAKVFSERDILSFIGELFYHARRKDKGAMRETVLAWRETASLCEGDTASQIREAVRDWNDPHRRKKTYSTLAEA